MNSSLALAIWLHFHHLQFDSLISFTYLSVGSESNNFFVWSSCDQIAMGGGGDGFGFVLDSDFATGESFKCKTYGNPVLVDKENGSFRIANVECWGFEGLFNKGNKSSQFQSESSNRNRWYSVCAISQWTRSCQVPFRSVVERILTMLCVPYTVLIVNNVHFNFLSGWHLFESPYYSYLSRQCSNPRISVFNSYFAFPVLHDLPLKDTGRTIRITSDYKTMDGISCIMISSSSMCWLMGIQHNLYRLRLVDDGTTFSMVKKHRFSWNRRKHEKTVYNNISVFHRNNLNKNNLLISFATGSMKVKVDIKFS